MQFDRRLRARLPLVAVLVTGGLVAPLAAPAAPLADGHLVCGRDIVVQNDFGQLPAHGLQIAEPLPAKKAASIVLNAGPGLTARPDALAAWNRAVDTWAALLGDNVTVVIDGDFASLGPGVLGSTSPRAFGIGYTTMRNQVVADAATDESYVSGLPGLAQFSLTIPTGFTWSGNVVSSKACLKALGFDMSFDDANPDATMTFSTGFASSFDYDSSDGIQFGKYDFEAIVVHEIGHALGFSSTVDIADFYRSQGQAVPLSPTVLDLFRLLPGAAASSFGTAPRLNTTGDLEGTQAWWDGTQDLLMSTGVQLGDGRQASHWKADELTGNFIGIMDPTLAPGDHEELTANDLRAFGVIGWDIVTTSITDCNGNSVEDADDISLGTSEDCNLNGVPDECDIASGTSLDPNGNGIPNECEVTGVETPEIRTLGLKAHPNPFNPRSVIFYEMPDAGDVSLAIYDVTGRKVATLAEGHRDAGRHEVVWNGQASDGARVASGVYYAVFQAGSQEQRLKLTLLK